MVQQQVPSATSFFSPKLKRAQITQTKWVSGGRLPVQSLVHTVRSNSVPLPPSPVRQTHEGITGRPPLPSGAVFARNLTGEPIGLVTSLLWSASSVCRS